MDLIHLGSWDKNKNPYLLRDCIILNEATASASQAIWPVTPLFQDPDSCLIGNLAISQWELVPAILSAEDYSKNPYSQKIQLVSPKA